MLGESLRPSLQGAEPSTAGEEVQELDLQMATVAASETLHDTLRTERSFAFQVRLALLQVSAAHLGNLWHN